MVLNPEAFSRRFRLLKKGEYKRVFAKAHKSSDNLFTILWRENGLGHPRLGLAISKRYLIRSVDRNLAKRLVRESFRRKKVELPAVDIVVLTERTIRQANSKEIADSLLGHWKTIQSSTLK